MTETSAVELSPAAVEALFLACESPVGEGVEVEGVAHTAWFRPDIIEALHGVIRSLLVQLPEQFMESDGGGWSFLNACQNRADEQWTGLHSVMEELFMLGMAAGYVTCQLPREFWSVLPGGMPYYVVHDNERKAK